MAPIFSKRTAVLALAGGLTLTGSLQAGFWNDLWCKKPQRPACSPACCPCYGYNQTTWRPWDCWYGGSLTPAGTEPLPVPTPADAPADPLAPAVPFGHTPVPTAPPLPASPVPQKTQEPQQPQEPRPVPEPQSQVPPAAFPFDGEFAPAEAAAPSPSAAAVPAADPATVPATETTPVSVPTVTEPAPDVIDERSAFPADADAAPQPSKQTSRSLFGDDDWNAAPLRVVPRISAVAPQAAVRPGPTVAAATSDLHSLPLATPPATMTHPANSAHDDGFVPQQSAGRPLPAATTQAGRIRLAASAPSSRSEQPQVAPQPGSVRIAQHVARDGQSVRVQQCAVADEEIGHVRAVATPNPAQGGRTARTEVRPVRWPFFGRASAK